MANENLALRTEGVRKQFGGIVAVDEVSLEITDGEIHSLIGPNGAGKTTLFNLITGEIQLDAGRIWAFDQDVTNWSIQRRTERGLGRTYQQPNLFPQLTVRESLFLGAGGIDHDYWKILQLWESDRPQVDRAEELAGLVELKSRLEDQVSNLSHGDHRRLGLGMALGTDPELLLLDEPAAGLSGEGRETIADLILELKSNTEMTILLIDHDMSFVFNLADRITVMDQGSIVVTGTKEEVRGNQKVQEIYYSGSEDNGQSIAQNS